MALLTFEPSSCAVKPRSSQPRGSLSSRLLIFPAERRSTNIFPLGSEVVPPQTVSPSEGFLSASSTFPTWQHAFSAPQHKLSPTLTGKTPEEIASTRGCALSPDFRDQAPLQGTKAPNPTTPHLHCPLWKTFRSRPWTQRGSYGWLPPETAQARALVRAGQNTRS